MGEEVVEGTEPKGAWWFYQWREGRHRVTERRGKKNWISVAGKKAEIASRQSERGRVLLGEEEWMAWSERQVSRLELQEIIYELEQDETVYDE